MIATDGKPLQAEHSMIQAHKKPGRKPQGFKVWTALLRPDQIAILQSTAADMRGRYQGNALMRDVVDFWIEHQNLFLTWLANRGK